MRYNREDIKLSFREDSVRFFVNEKKKTVVCKLTGYLIGPTHIKSKYIYVTNSPKFVPVEFTTVAKAKCNGEDTFDVNRGKRIALARAENKMYIDAVRYLETLMADYDKIMTAASLFTDKAYTCCAHNEDYIESLSFPAHPNYKTEVNEPNRGK